MWGNRVVRICSSPEEVQGNDFCVTTIVASSVELKSKVVTMGREEQIVMVEHELIMVLW